jgi:amino acid adenylation domain-containing protein
VAYLLQHLLSESAAKYPDKEALLFKGESMTYAELDVETNRLANTLSALGVQRGELVGIYLNRGISSIVALFGILKAGATYLPIDPLCPFRRLNYIVEKCRTRLLVSSYDKLGNIERTFPVHSPIENILSMTGLDFATESLKATKLIDWTSIRKTAKCDALVTNAIDSDLAYVLFTSGSTGRPKGVMISHLNSLTFINSAGNFFKTTMHDRFSNVCPLHFDMSVFDIFVALKIGACVVIIPETTALFPVRMAELIAETRISVWNSVPSALCLLATLSNLADFDFSTLRLVLFAGEIFPLKYLRRLQDAISQARFCNMYGQTEANSSTYYWVEPGLSDGRGVLPIGRPLPNFEVFALDERGELISKPEEEGELYVRASSVAVGYWEDVDKTEKSFVKNPLRPDLNEIVYRTGDLVRLDFDGNYVFLGRKDHMIKSRGYRIELGEIEAVLCGHLEIKSAVVIPIPDELIGNRISAIVVPVSPGGIAKDRVLQYCAQHLPKYMVPEIIEIRDSLPTTSSGKIDRVALSAAK